MASRRGFHGDTRPFPKPRPRSAPRSSNKRSVVSCPACAAAARRFGPARPRWRASTRPARCSRPRRPRRTSRAGHAIPRRRPSSRAPRCAGRSRELPSRGTRLSRAPARDGRTGEPGTGIADPPLARGTPRASRPGRRMRVRHRRTRVPSVSEDTTPAWKTARFQKVETCDISLGKNVERRHHATNSKTRGVGTLLHEVLSVPLTPSPPFPRRFRASVSPLRPRG